MIDILTNDLLLTTALAEEIEKAAPPDQTPVDGTISVIRNIDLAKILIVPIIIWFVKGILVYSVERINLIRHLYSEIELEITAHREFYSTFKKWKTDNIDIQPPIAKKDMKLINFESNLTYPVYHSSQSIIVKVLWGQEISKIHFIYSQFRDIQVFINNVANGLWKAGDDFSINRTNEFELIQRESEHVIQLIEMLDITVPPRNIARAQFYRPTIYLFPLLFVLALAAGIWWLLGSL